MQSNSIGRTQNTILEISSSDSMQLTYTNSVEQHKTFVFEVSFEGQMDMYSDVDTVAKYLDAHEGWFCRCAQPMKVEPLTDNGYVLTIGKYGSFGYEVEPKIGVVLNPPVDRVYLMHTIPIPNYDSAGYDVNYRAAMKLEEITLADRPVANKRLFSKAVAPDRFTRVTWDLDLKVRVDFPQFITKLSANLIQVTGDRLLTQIVRQISPRLTYKVQQDFHTSHDLSMPPKSSRQLRKVDKSEQYAV